jgi:hopanoid biosynthesis associated protein HpnK
MPPRLIVHADDFGLTEGVNAGILQAHCKGIVTSTSIMANGHAFADAVSIARQTPTLDIGIHLTLVEEQPIVDPERIPTLIGANGRFHAHARSFAVRYLLGRIDLKSVRLELQSQIAKVCDAGLSPTHLDSHQHLHMLPGVLGIVLELANEFQIPAVRVPYEERLLKNFRRTPFLRMVQALVLNRLACAARKRVDQSADRFLGFLFGGHVTQPLVMRLITDLRDDGTWELMCHPGDEEQATSPYSHWGYNWRDELSALMDPAVIQLVRQRRIELISYRELIGAINTLPRSRQV